MIYPVHVYGMPALRKVARDIDGDYNGLGKLIGDMFETMYQAEGVGFAANQIGITDRVVVVDATKVENAEEHGLEDFRQAFINPHIIEEDGEETEFNEGCLSIPNIREDVKRPSRIRLQYMDENLSPFDQYYEGYKARILQHELDHLNGILFTDRISPLRRRMLNAKLKAISKGNTEVSYKIRFPGK